MTTTQNCINLEIQLKNKYFLHWNTFNINLDYLTYSKSIKNKILNIGVFLISINPRWPPYLVKFDKKNKQTVPMFYYRLRGLLNPKKQNDSGSVKIH